MREESEVEPAPLRAVSIRRRAHPGQLLLAWVTILALVGVGAGVWRARFQSQLYPAHWSEVEPGMLFRCNAIPIHQYRQILRENRIKLVIKFEGPKVSSIDREIEEAAERELGVVSRSFALQPDGTGDAQTYATILELIAKSRQEREPVLVNCSTGIHQTGGVIAAYSLLIANQPAQRVLEEMQVQGLNLQEDRVLINFLNQNLAAMAALLVEHGVISEVPSPIPTLGK